MKSIPSFQPCTNVSYLLPAVLFLDVRVSKRERRGTTITMHLFWIFPVESSERRVDSVIIPQKLYRRECHCSVKPFDMRILKPTMII